MTGSCDWRLTPEYTHLSHLFGELDAIFTLKGEPVTGDRISDVIRIEHQGIRYYVKRYYIAGKGLRRFFGKPRIRSEWENLLWFARQGIPTAPVVGYGMQRRFGLFQCGALITQEIPDTIDLAEAARNHDPRLQDRRWVRHVSRQVADAMRIMHAHGFIHNDFKWRNLLVDNHDRLFLIDCPLGAFWRGKLFEYRRMKEFATLDRVARYKLSNTQRLRFYLQYSGRNKLGAEGKAFIRKLAQRKDRRVSSFAR
ncbi:hypothetical protein MTYP_00595 [Methylophilaceae bacterium]|nr:hypothetical protein MTYP_00595 [Methylophilaceae bacterium]